MRSEQKIVVIRLVFYGLLFLVVFFLLCFFDSHFTLFPYHYPLSSFAFSTQSHTLHIYDFGSVMYDIIISTRNKSDILSIIC